MLKFSALLLSVALARRDVCDDDVDITSSGYFRGTSSYKSFRAEAISDGGFNSA